MSYFQKMCVLGANNIMKWYLIKKKITRQKAKKPKGPELKLPV